MIHAGRAAPWINHGGRIRPRQIFPALEQTPDLHRGELRLAAEVAVAELRGQLVPTWVHERAFDTLNVVAFE